MHIMAFSPVLWDRFLDHDGYTRGLENVIRDFKDDQGVEYKGLVTPNLVNIAKEFLNCTTADHIPLENDGLSGSRNSHFERYFFFNEMMTASDFFHLKFS